MKIPHEERASWRKRIEIDGYFEDEEAIAAQPGSGHVCVVARLLDALEEAEARLTATEGNSSCIGCERVDESFDLSKVKAQRDALAAVLAQKTMLPPCTEPGQGWTSCPRYTPPADGIAFLGEDEGCGEDDRIKCWVNFSVAQGASYAG